jgi:ParB-like chromosome segregation protein Spo0J
MSMHDKTKESIMEIQMASPEQAALIKIDPEFKARINPLRPDELAQLEANIKAEGCRDPLVTWNDVVVDGHHRLEICNRLGIPFRRQAMHFENRAEALRWVDLNQLGRRNLTQQQRKLLVGRLYNKTKPAQGGTGANKSTGQMTEPARSARALGKKVGMSERAVRRAAEFAAAVDTNPELAARVKRGEKIQPIKPKMVGKTRKPDQAEVVECCEIDVAFASLERTWKAATQDARDKFLASFNLSPAIAELLQALKVRHGVRSQTGQNDRSAESAGLSVEVARPPVTPPLPEVSTDDAPLVAIARQILAELGELGLGDMPRSTVRQLSKDITQKHRLLDHCYYANLDDYLREGNARAHEFADQVALHMGPRVPCQKPARRADEVALHAGGECAAF